MIDDKKSRRKWLYPIILTTVILTSACSQEVAMDKNQKKVLESQIERVLDPAVPAEDFSALVDDSADFALDFYQYASRQNGNLFYSPYSISSALAMAYGGAGGRTALEMADTLHFSLPQERLHPAFNRLDLLLNQGIETENGESQPFQLDVANAIWGQAGHSFKQEYLDLLALNYGAGLRLVDFVNNAGTAREDINRWVSDKTQEKIQDLIPSGGINSSTRLVLANAIYFKADWLNPFANSKTHDAPFTLLDGDEIQVSMMEFEDPVLLPYFAGEGFQAVELPYVGDEVSMLVLMPERETFDTFETELDRDQLNLVLNGLSPIKVRLFFPKFRFTSEYELTGILSDLGMPSVFCSGSPDFSGMDDEGQLCIGGVYHKAFVAVDEKGTEAAAATALVMKALAMIDPDVQIISFDHPFIFLIRHKTSGAILFAGRMLNPLD